MPPQFPKVFKRQRDWARAKPSRSLPMRKGREIEGKLRGYALNFVRARKLASISPGTVAHGYLPQAFWGAEVGEPWHAHCQRPARRCDLVPCTCPKARSAKPITQNIKVWSPRPRSPGFDMAFRLLRNRWWNSQNSYGKYDQQFSKKIWSIDSGLRGCPLHLSMVLIECSGAACP